MTKSIAIAGATGNLGGRIVHYLLKKDVEVRALVRQETATDKINNLENQGVKVYQVDMMNTSEISKVLEGVSCVVSALAGLKETIIDVQKVLLDAAVSAGVPRFIPSDFSTDYRKFSLGENRNLDLRREFTAYLDTKSIKATTIFNGAFMDLLTGEMPLILTKQKLILYWGDAHHKYHFTSVENTAEYTASAALDDNTPRHLIIAGDQISPKEIKSVMTQITGENFRLFRPGGKKLLGIVIQIAKKLAPGKQELYPAWQGMQYMHNMIDDRATIKHLDNSRYVMQWTSAKQLLQDFFNVHKNTDLRS